MEIFFIRLSVMNAAIALNLTILFSEQNSEPAS